MAARFCGVLEDPNTPLPPIVGIKTAPLLDLEAAVKVAETRSADLQQAMRDDGLLDLLDFVRASLAGAALVEPWAAALIPDINQRAALHFYTQESPLYRVLNQILRDSDRNKAKPFFPYMKLLLTAVVQLPPQVITVNRGIKAIFDANLYQPRAMMTWWSINSTTASVAVLQNEDFLGTTGPRVMFQIAAQNAYNIAPYSAIKREAEYLLICGTRLEVVSVLDAGNALFIVQLKELDKPAVLPQLELPPPPPPSTANADPEPAVAHLPPSVAPPVPPPPHQEASPAHKCNTACSNCKCRATIVWNSLYGAGHKALLCTDCVQNVPSLSKAAFLAATPLNLREVCVVLPSDLDDEWRGLLQQKPPRHIAWFGDVPEPPFPPLATLVTRLNQHLATWVAQTQQASLFTLALIDTADDATICVLHGLTQLRHLVLWSCEQITDAGLAHLKALVNLQSLDLCNCDQITEAGLAHLKALVNLQTLDLSYCEQITDAGLAHLKALANLQTLNLNTCRQITDAGLAHLKVLVNLQTLDLSHCNHITDAGLAHLKALVNLQSLDLERCNEITDAGLAHLKALVNLQTLDLLWCYQITDAGLAHVGFVKDLQRPW